VSTKSSSDDEETKKAVDDAILKKAARLKRARMLSGHYRLKTEDLASETDIDAEKHKRTKL
jgi:hypothetical protein